MTHLKKTALYLAHMNPVTIAHAQIIDELRSIGKTVIIMPVVFTRDGSEVNSKSFPFTFETRREMITALFGDTVQVSKKYEFCYPFSQYKPPLIARASWSLRKQILSDVKGSYFTYTGDIIEWCMLLAYGLRPRLRARKATSATNVRQEMYDSVNNSNINWQKNVPKKVSEIINREDNWNTVKGFANSADTTRRVLGMKFPV